MAFGGKPALRSKDEYEETWVIFEERSPTVASSVRFIVDCPKAPRRPIRMARLGKCGGDADVVEVPYWVDRN
jgi:hypothetical protein